jgi:immune inhibitor A
MATHSNKTVARVFCSYHSQNCWAYLAGIGWKQVQTGNADGCTNVHIVLTSARGNGKLVTVVTNAADNRIEQVYM